ncbi:hypothetical protein C882_0989 [Caenispirillum salinarum AK4]|uniref:Uncharacterized protein n=1 Tax=Caenispirillum salinarum AK4 TaxID=1238182 RepID=K9GR06_9PROT|nr:hypothetical protein C882_0989 [Caenispirillum salinarum AK4]
MVTHGCSSPSSLMSDPAAARGGRRHCPRNAQGSGRVSRAAAG